MKSQIAKVNEAEIEITLLSVKLLKIAFRRGCSNKPIKKAWRLISLLLQNLIKNLARRLERFHTV